MYQCLTGKHPFHFNGDDEHAYITRINREPIDQILEKNCKKYELSELSTSLLKRLLARNTQDRYRVYEALSHPWISRNMEHEVPLTQNEANLRMDLENRFKFAQNAFLSMAITKFGRQIKKKFLAEEIMNRQLRNSSKGNLVKNLLLLP